MRVLLVEDDAALCTWLAKALRRRQFAVDCRTDGVAADHSLAFEDYDAVILDLWLPRMDGLEVLRRLRERGSRIPVLVLTAKSTIDDRVAGLNQGADDYLPKPFDIGELEARLKALIRRSQAGGSSCLKLGTLEYEGGSRTFRVQGKALMLRLREHAVLETLMLRAGRLVSKQALYEHVFDFDSTANVESLDIYVHRVRRHIEGTGAVIVTLRGLGYTLEASP